MRIQKYMSEQGMCSRREAERYVLEGLVTVNDKVVRVLGTQIDPTTDKVELRVAEKNTQDRKTTIALHKPRGIVSSKVKTEGKTVFDLLPQFAKLNIIGRLDKASEGLLLLSNDGALAHAVIGEEHTMEKEYEVNVRERITPGKIAVFERGIELEDGPTLPAKVGYINNHVFRIILREGRKHQIRRMCEYVRLTVTRLIRLRIGTITLAGLQVGEFRELSRQEAAKLKQKFEWSSTG